MSRNLQHTDAYSRLTTGLIALVLALIGTSGLNAQLACNDLIQVSLNENCVFSVNLDMVLEAPPADTSCLELVIKDGSGNIIPGNIFNSLHRDQTFSYSVNDTCNSNSCWGEISVEDKLPPQFDCETYDTVWCSQTSYVLPLDKVFEACGTWDIIIKSDNTIDYPCDSLWSGKRIIEYCYEDESGNRSEICTKQVCYRRATLGDVDFPADTIFTCHEFEDAEPIRTGVPEVDGYPINPDAYFCEVNCTYEDTRLDICPASYKILRKWTCYDWCLPTGPENPTIDYQVIKVLDEDGPQVYCPTTSKFRDTIGTDVWQCTGWKVLPEPHVLIPGQAIQDSGLIYIIRECSDVSYSVKHIAAENPGDCTPGPGTPNSDKVSFNRLTERWEAHDLPLGCNWFYYTFTDECGNSTECSFDIYVEDDVPPIPVCDEHTTVTLNDSGVAKIFALTFDDGSIDNCEIDSMDARRMDSKCDPTTTDYGPFVVFCCADLGGSVMVEFRVHDKAGNVNTCMVEVTVTDKQAPFIMAPPNITVDCRFDWDPSNLNVFGKVVPDKPWRKEIYIKDPHYAPSNYVGLDGYAEDNCIDIIIDTATVYDLECGRGTIRRTFTAIDPGGLKSSAVQVITIDDLTPFGKSDITFPKDEYLKGCMGIATDTSKTGIPTYKNVDCATVAATHDDRIFTGVVDACFKIERTWTVVDWCQFDVSTGAGIWEMIQIIKVSDEQAPVFKNCDDMLFCDESAYLSNGQCLGQVDIIPDVEDECTPYNQLQMRYRVDEFKTGTFGPWVNLPVLSGVYPVGTHEVQWNAKDGCGNESWCRFDFEVKDCKNPTPYCRNGIVTVLMEGVGEVSIWANDFDLGSFDNCTDKDDLRFSFSEDVDDIGRTYDCDDMNGNLSLRDTVRIYVWDECDNFDYCETVIEIQDNGKCVGNLGMVSGKITNERNEPIKGINVDIVNPISGAIVKSGFSDDNGNYAISGIPLNNSYTIRPAHDINDINGVSTQDLVLIQRDLLGIMPLHSAYSVLASDANNTESKSARDLAEIRKLVLGLYKAFPDHTSWTFIPSDYSFADPLNPWGPPYEMAIPFMDDNKADMNFIGVKIGDVNGDAYLGLTKIKTRSAGTYDMTYDARLLSDGNYHIDFYQDGNAPSLSGLQMTVDFGQDVEIIELFNGVLLIGDENFANHNERLTFSWGEFDGLNENEKDGILFSMIVDIDEWSNLSATSDVTIAECYDNLDERWDLSLRNGERNENGGAFTLMQNIPNPFGSSTLISFELPEQQDFRLSFYDPAGRMLKVINGMGAKGYNQIVVSQADFPQSSSNVVFYQLDTRNNSATRKLIMTR